MNLPDGFDVNGVYCYQSADDPQTFAYIPGSPLPETSPAGTPTLSLWVVGGSGQLQLGTRWDVDQIQLETLRAAIHQRWPDLPEADLTLRLAPLTVSQAVLQLGDGSTITDALQTSPTAGFPPFSAIFSATLTAEQSALAANAIGGAPGYLLVSYQAALSGAAQPLLVTRTTDVSSWFPAGDGPSHIRLVAA